MGHFFCTINDKPILSLCNQNSISWCMTFLWPSPFQVDPLKLFYLPRKLKFGTGTIVMQRMYLPLVPNLGSLHVSQNVAVLHAIEGPCSMTILVNNYISGGSEGILQRLLGGALQMLSETQRSFGCQREKRLQGQSTKNLL